MKHPRSTFEALARLGYVARGMVYLIIGLLALFSGGFAGEADSQGALSTLLYQPFGRVLVGVICLGFLGFVAWRVAQGVFNADRLEATLKNILARVGKLLSGAGYLALGCLAGAMALGLEGTGTDRPEDSWTAVLLKLPHGPLMVALIALAITSFGLGQIWKAVTGGYATRLHLPKRHQRLYLALCTYGFAARGAIFAIIGGLLFHAALTVAPEDAGNIGEALDSLRGLPFGGALYVVGALGLIAFAGACLILAMHRKVEPAPIKVATQS